MRRVRRKGGAKLSPSCRRSSQKLARIYHGLQHLHRPLSCLFVTTQPCCHRSVAFPIPLIHPQHAEMKRSLEWTFKHPSIADGHLGNDFFTVICTNFHSFPVLSFRAACLLADPLTSTPWATWPPHVVLGHARRYHSWCTNRHCT